MLLPLPLLLLTLVDLLSLGLVLTGIYCLYRVLRQMSRPRVVLTSARRAVSQSQLQPEVIARREPVPNEILKSSVFIPLVLGLLLAVFTFAGRHAVQFAYPSGPDEPQETRSGTVQYITGASNARLRVETYGPPNAPTLLLTHGWGMNSTEWYYAKRDLSDRFKLIVWDLPGLGLSGRPDDQSWALDAMAQDLHAVLAVAKGKPVILVGHSIGGMINLTFCRRYPEALGREVAGIAQIDTTYTNPVETMPHRPLNEALQKPVAEPILHAMIALSPLVHVLNWISYQNGTAFIMNAKTGFASGTRGQIDFVSRLQAKASPAVIASGTLGMFHWDCTGVLPRIHVPVLILVGQQDTTTLPAASQTMHQKMPEAKLLLVSPAAHYSLLELNREIDTALGQFATALLDQNEVSRGRVPPGSAVPR